jgi:chromosome segregation ATPase
MAVLALGGCALQSEVMEIDEEMGAIKALQKELEKGIADANEAAETMRAIGVRMAAVEDRLKAEVRPELEARITKGMDDLDRALEGVTQAREANEARIREAETFFVERLEKLSSRQQALSTRITAMEAEGAPSSPRARAARAELTADLETLRTKVGESSEALARVQEQFSLLTDTVAGLAESQQLARQQRAGVTEQAAERLDLRLSNLEARAADAAAGQERLAQEIGGLTDRLAALSTAREEAARKDAALANDAAAALAARLDALERSEAERARSEAERAKTEAERAKTEAERAAQAQARARAQAEANARLAARLDELAARTDALAAARTRAEAERAVLSEDAAGQLATQMDALKARDAAGAQARQRLQEQVTGLADRLAALSAGQAADQAERAALSEDAAGRLEARVAAVEAANAQAAADRGKLVGQIGDVVDRLAAVTTAQQQAADRAAALERQDNAAAAERQQLALQVSAAADAASRPPEGVRTALADLERRVAEMEGGSGRIQRLAELTDQLGVLGSQVTERLDAQASDFTRLAARLDRLQEGVEGFQAAPPPWGEALDKKVTFLADEVAPRIDTQNRELAAIADTVAAGRERNDLELSRANERVNALGTSLVERIEGLEGRVARAEQTAEAAGGAGGVGGAPIDAAGREEVEALSRRVDVLGREVPARVDRLTDLVGQLRDHLERVGERIALLETIQKEESNDLRERFNALSAALSELERGAP